MPCQRVKDQCCLEKLLLMASSLSCYVQVSLQLWPFLYGFLFWFSLILQLASFAVMFNLELKGVFWPLHILLSKLLVVLYKNLFYIIQLM